MNTTVSIIVPCYNEEETIQYFLEAIYFQSYPRHLIDVIIADGLSTDGTRNKIAEFVKAHDSLRTMVLDNPKRIIPAALNLALKAAQGDIIVRLDGKTVPFREYVENCVRDIEADRGEIVGGRWEIHPGADTWVARAIAVAATHPLNVSEAQYRHSDTPAYVDTVPFGAFRRSLLDKAGIYDESFLVNEDYEFNTRVRENGGRIWMNPGIRTVYFARSTLLGLLTQYYRNGFWKYRILKRYPGSIHWLQALPPLLVFSLLTCLFLGFFGNLFLYLLGVEFLLYLAVLLAVGIYASEKNKDLTLLPGIPMAIMVMHLACGSGFLWSIIVWLVKSNKAELS